MRDSTEETAQYVRDESYPHLPSKIIKYETY
jgi:hypothetical protein